MTAERLQQLLHDQTDQLTPDEVESGWHFCPEWDDMIIGPDCNELVFCTCNLPPAGVEARKKEIMLEDGRNPGPYFGA